ncbi:PLP-dependent aminotransferase family protein [Dyella caseinilytica]|uniref:PLP-dependent aminotransferase family protein n=1 Tax=Dyella caseinilytica TaxID=1849581 RepID=A0ABX7GWW2_9GAMM|nr:PLP-dependent aminotransferase family protein [Dyella caseinilytica]QRN54207.1 PLP-dependent aminotransferase family protein [Dyella caseinilytica]GFZ92358.1 GntR family transcriptional regulator [Dyella caseinilytica]
MYLELDGHGPLYDQLTRALKASILEGRISAGTQLPPTRELADELDLSRTTVLAAYEQLRAEGFIAGRVGSGSYVSKLQAKPAAHHAETAIPAPSRYAERARAVRNWNIPRIHRGVRYNLQYGNPLVNPALNNAWGRELARAAAYTPLHINDVSGLAALRQQTCDYLARRRGVRADPDDVMIVSGTQQAIELTTRVLLNEADRVVLEEPHYFGAHQALVAHGAAVVAVRADQNGLVCDELPEQSPRLIYVTPSHQFPSGSILSLQRRKALLCYAERHQCWILEDDYDGEFSYESHPMPALRSLDEGDRVIYVGTFSKVMFGGLRLAYMVLPAALRQDFRNAKYLSDMACPVIEQAALAHFMEDGGFERHLRLARKELKLRRDALIAGLKEHARDRVELTDTPAGMHVVVWLRDYDAAKCEALIGHAHDKGLGLYPVAPLYLDTPPRPGLMLGYCGASVTELREAMQLFGECLDHFESH